MREFSSCITVMVNRISQLWEEIKWETWGLVSFKSLHHKTPSIEKVWKYKYYSKLTSYIDFGSSSLPQNRSKPKKLK